MIRVCASGEQEDGIVTNCNSYSPELYVDGLKFPEGPHWHDGKLWFSDVFGGAVYNSSERGTKNLVAKIDGRPSGNGFLPDGTLIVTEMLSGKVLQIADGQARPYVDLRGITPYMINDMFVTNDGRAYVGEFGYDFIGGEDHKMAKLITISPSGEASVAAEPINFPNGIQLSADGKTLLVAESMASLISAFDVDENGALSNKHTWGEHPGFVDGICLDTAGGLWIGNHSACKYVRMVEGGEITDTIETPGRWALSCGLGGPQGTTLFLATCETDGVDYDNAIGRVETVEVTHPGVHAGAEFVNVGS